MTPNKRLYLCVMAFVWIAAFAVEAGAQSLIFPHFAQGDGCQTLFTLNNLSATATTVNIDFISQAGSVTRTSAITLAASAAASIEPPVPSPFVGWARMTISPASSEVFATETIRLFDSSGSLISETDTGPSPQDTTLWSPLENNNGYYTAVAIVNASNQAQSVSLTLRGTNGIVQTSASLSLLPMHQTAKFLSEIIPSLQDFEGTLELSAAIPLSALVLRQGPEGTFNTVPFAWSGADSYFSPKGGISARIVQEVEAATISIDIAMYEFTRSEIGAALVAAKNRGVSIRVIMDSSEAGESGSQLSRLEAAGISVKQMNGTGGGIMHNKYAIVDGRLLVTGSYNWTTAAEEDNNENALFLRDPPVIAAYQANFNALWPQ